LTAAIIAVALAFGMAPVESAGPAAPAVEPPRPRPLLVLSAADKGLMSVVEDICLRILQPTDHDGGSEYFSQTYSDVVILGKTSVISTSVAKLPPGDIRDRLKDIVFGVNQGEPELRSCLDRPGPPNLRGPVEVVELDKVVESPQAWNIRIDHRYRPKSTQASQPTTAYGLKIVDGKEVEKFIGCVGYNMWPQLEAWVPPAVDCHASWSLKSPRRGTETAEEVPVEEPEIPTPPPTPIDQLTSQPRVPVVARWLYGGAVAATVVGGYFGVRAFQLAHQGKSWSGEAWASNIGFGVAVGSLISALFIHYAGPGEASGRGSASRVTVLLERDRGTFLIESHW
jgi:hypothetical protein